MRTRVFILLFTLGAMSSCMKKDTPVVLPEKGDAFRQTLVLGADYSTQYYYSLHEQKVVHTSQVASWHLAFDNSTDGESVFLNGGVGMALVKTNKTAFKSITHEDCDGQNWLQDDPNGNGNMSAIGHWNASQLSRDKIYILRLDAAGQQLRTLKLVEVTATDYKFQIGQIGSSMVTSCSISKDPNRVYSYYDLKNLSTCGDVEPLKDTWDLLFTRYGFTFYDQTPALPYIVTGVLTNPAAQAFKDSTHEFKSITADIIGTQNFSTDRDVIGYDWKYYDFDLGQYHLNKNYNYIIKTSATDVYKLNFESFYDNNGVKGTPTFAFRQIQ